MDSFCLLLDTLIQTVKVVHQKGAHLLKKHLNRQPAWSFISYSCVMYLSFYKCFYQSISPVLRLRQCIYISELLEEKVTSNNDLRFNQTVGPNLQQIDNSNRDVSVVMVKQAKDARHHVQLNQHGVETWHCCHSFHVLYKDSCKLHSKELDEYSRLQGHIFT